MEFTEMEFLRSFYRNGVFTKFLQKWSLQINKIHKFRYQKLLNDFMYLHVYVCSKHCLLYINYHVFS